MIANRFSAATILALALAAPGVAAAQEGPVLYGPPAPIEAPAPAAADPAAPVPAAADPDAGFDVPYQHYTLRPGESLREMDARYKRTFTRWRIAGWAMAAADIATTRRCLARGTCHEGNPIYGRNPSLGRMLAVRVPIELAIDLIARRVFRQDPQAAIVLVKVKTVGTGLVAGLNLRF